MFLDDILIYSPTLEEHVNHLRQVFSKLREHQLFLKRSKCSFAKKELEYLGHIISDKGVAIDASKIAAMQDWPPPTTVTELRGFWVSLVTTGSLSGVMASLLNHLLNYSSRNSFAGILLPKPRLMPYQRYDKLVLEQDIYAEISKFYSVVPTVHMQVYVAYIHSYVCVYFMYKNSMYYIYTISLYCFFLNPGHV